MKFLITSVVALLLLGASSAQAQYPFPLPKPWPCYYPVPPLRAPDACGPAWYGANCNGMAYGPNYNVYPGFQPFQGVIPLPGCPGSAAAQQFKIFQAAFPSHPYVRSPRDFYMID